MAFFLSLFILSICVLMLSFSLKKVGTWWNILSVIVAVCSLFFFLFGEDIFLWLLFNKKLF